MLTLLLPSLPKIRRDPALRELLDPLLTRADRLDDLAEGRTAQLGKLFGLQPLPAAALTRSRESPPQTEGLWLRADPGHVMVDIAAVRLMACGEMDLTDAERAALEPDLAALFADEGMAFEAPSVSRWYLRLPDDSSLPTFHPPELALGADLEDWLPTGAEQGRWRRLLNETQVLLHQHPVNAARLAQGRIAINSLWFWGAGRLPTKVHAPCHWVASNEPLLLALAALAGITGEASGEEGLVDLHGASIAAVTNALGHAATGALLVFADGPRYRVSRWQRLRFWRRVPQAAGEGT